MATPVALVADGVVGRLTRTALADALARKLPGLGGAAAALQRARRRSLGLSAPSSGAPASSGAIGVLDSVCQ